MRSQLLLLRTHLREDKNDGGGVQDRARCLNRAGPSPYPRVRLRSPLPRILVACVSVLSLFPGTALGEGSLPPAGNYRGEQALLAVSTLTAGGVSWVTGHVLSSVCGQDPGRVGLDGVLQGNQLVGRLLLCVRCARGNVAQDDRVVDFLALWLPETEQFVGYVTLEPSCTTPGATASDQPVRVSFARDALGTAPLKPFHQAALQKKALQEFEKAGAVTGDRALQALLRAVSFDPSPRNLSRLGEALMASGELDRAQLVLERATADPEATWEPFLQLSRLHVRRDALAAGRQAFKEAVNRRMPDVPGKFDHADFEPLRNMKDHGTWASQLRSPELPR